VAPPARSAFLLGVEAYQAGRYFEAHERWEEPWLVEQDLPRKRLLQGLIQIAAAMHKLQREGGAQAASRLLARAQARLVEAVGRAHRALEENPHQTPERLGREIAELIAALDEPAAAGSG
jgi:predicted metal-dependent hydrolase